MLPLRSRTGWAGFGLFIAIFQNVVQTLSRSGESTRVLFCNEVTHTHLIYSNILLRFVLHCFKQITILLIPLNLKSNRLTFLTTNECDFSSFFSQAFELSYESMEAEDGGCWANLFEFQTTEVKGVRLWNASTGIYKVFYLLIDGITNCLNGHIQNPVQKTICEVVMTSLNLLIDVKGT